MVKRTKQLVLTSNASFGEYLCKPLPMYETKEPALGRTRLNSAIVLPSVSTATVAIKNAQGARDPINATVRPILRKIPSAGAKLASVAEMVSKRLRALRCRRGCACTATPSFPAVELITNLLLMVEKTGLAVTCL